MHHYFRMKSIYFYLIIKMDKYCSRFVLCPAQLELYFHNCLPRRAPGSHGSQEIFWERFGRWKWSASLSEGSPCWPGEQQDHSSFNSCWTSSFRSSILSSGLWSTPWHRYRSFPWRLTHPGCWRFEIVRPLEIPSHLCGFHDILTGSVCSCFPYLTSFLP